MRNKVPRNRRLLIKQLIGLEQEVVVLLDPQKRAMHFWGHVRTVFHVTVAFGVGVPTALASHHLQLANGHAVGIGVALGVVAVGIAESVFRPTKRYREHKKAFHELSALIDKSANIRTVRIANGESNRMMMKLYEDLIAEKNEVRSASQPVSPWIEKLAVLLHLI